MASYRLNFVKNILEKIIPPTKPIDKTGGVYDTYYDLKERGLILIVSNGGNKTFYLYKKIKNNPERIKLGGFPELSIYEARKLAQQNKRLIISGINPNHEKRKLKRITNA
jgi:hypothetical protein